MAQTANVPQAPRRPTVASAGTKSGGPDSGVMIGMVVLGVLLVANLIATIVTARNEPEPTPAPAAVAPSADHPDARDTSVSAVNAALAVVEGKLGDALYRLESIKREVSQLVQEQAAGSERRSQVDQQTKLLETMQQQIQALQQQAAGLAPVNGETPAPGATAVTPAPAPVAAPEQK